MPFNSEGISLTELLKGTKGIFVLDPMQVDTLIDELVVFVQWIPSLAHQING